jgi:hypothetical protein
MTQEAIIEKLLSLTFEQKQEIIQLIPSFYLSENQTFLVIC